MGKAEGLLLDFDLIISNARRAIERISDDNIDFKPHERATPLGRLAMHCATMLLLGIFIIEDEELDQANREGRPRPDTTFHSREQCITQLDDAAAKLRNAIRTADDDHLEALWNFHVGEHIILKQSRLFTIRFLVLDHLIHHTAQIGLYLHLSNAKVPALYGPSADEQFAFDPVRDLGM